MLTSKEKRKFIEATLSDVATMSNIEQMQSELYRLLLNDTTNGKLYKYRSFDENGYALANLKSGTLHCSNPTLFNDPFDCKIGITFESLYRAKFGEELDLLHEILEKFYLVINEKISISECNQDEQRVITKLLSKNTIMQFIAENRNQNCCDEEIEVLLKENVVVILELLQTVLEDKKFTPSFGICASLIPNLLAKVDSNSIFKLSEENASLEDFARANGIAVDADEIELTMLLSEKINPSLADAVQDVQNLIDSKEQLIAHRTSEMFLVGSLCTDFKNRLMWSHYADSHRGFCVEYDYSNAGEIDLSKLPLPVIYDENRPLLPWEPALNNTPENVEKACTQLLMGLLIKDKAWEYENEWRIFIDAQEDANLIMPKISCIYLGVSIDEANRAAIINIAKDNNIPVKQMKVDRGKFELHAESIFC